MDLSDDTGEVAADEDLYQIWMVYTSTNDLQQFKRYLRCFLEVYKAYVDVELNHLITGFTAEGPHLTKLPDGILQAVGRQLSLTSDLYIQVQEPEALQYCQQLIKCLIVICRNLDNVAFVASCDYVGHIVTMATVVLSKISSDGGECSVEEEGKRTQLKSFVSHVIHFFECMYDPYFVWRRRLRGLLEEDYTECIWWTVEKSRFKFRPAVLHVEVVPFFYECFQQPNLDMDVQIRLFHLFGAIIAGAQHNALKAICPATLDVLLKVLSRPSNIPSENTSHTTSESARLGVASSTLGVASSMQQAINTVMMVKDLVLRCIIRMVHVIHCCSPDQRQVEVGAVLEGYYQSLLRISEHHSPESFQLQLTMINNIQEMLQCPDHSALQVIFVAEGTFETFVTFLHRTPLRGIEAQKVAMGIIRVMSAVMSGSNTAKDKFREKVGYHKFVEALKSLGQPSQELLKTLMDLVIEDTHVDGKSYSVQNAQAALMLVQWLPDIQEHELQILLTECLLLLANASNYNQMALCNEGMVGAILHILHREKQINNQAVMYLIQLLDTLGSLSITGAELKQLICLLKPDEDDHIIPYAGKLIKSLSSMSHKNTRQGALHYFDFQTPDAGILVPGIRKWPGAGFTFHAWVCLEQQDALRQVMARRQLYSFCSGTGSGFEAFFTPGNILVVCVCIKKEFHTVAVTDHPITDQEWHCIDIVHTSSKGPFSKSQLTVYIDGRPRLSAFVKYPPLSEPLNVCCIGLCPRAHYDKSHDYSVPSSEQKKGWVPFKIPLVKSINQSPSVVSVPGHDLDNQFGPPRSFQGQLGSVCVFCDPIMANHITTIFSQGTNNMLLFQSDDGTLTELSSKLLLHYNAKACQTTTCLDLSFNQNHGRLVGNKCTTWDCKEMINCVGGIQVLFPILEHINKMPMLSESGVPMSPASPRSPASDHDLQEEWVVVRSSSHADAKLDQNQAASFLTLLRNIASSSEVNQELLVQTQGIATLGALLQKVEPHMIDVHVLMAIQLLVETVAESNKTLLYHIYQYMLFDFRIWSRSEFPVRIGHIQYLSTIIKEDRKYFRKKYGVQYMLDVIRAYYSKSAESKPSADDCRTIRVSLLGLVKYYVVKEITADELNCLLGFIAAVNEQELIMEALDLLMSLILRSGKKDQIFLLIFEDGKADILCNLLAKQYSTSLKEKVLKLYSVLMKTDKVYDKNKSVLRFHERGFYPGLVSLMQTSEVSLDMAKYMLDQVLATDTDKPFNTAAGYDAALAVLQLLHHSTLPIKLEATRKLMVALFAKPSAAKTFAKQVGWQDALVRLLILKPKPATTKIYTTTEQGTFEQQPANKEKDNIHSANQEKDTIHSTNQEKENINSTNQNENEKSLLTVFPPFEDATNHSIPVIDVENGAKFSLGESPSENLNSLSHSVSDHSIPRFSRTILFEDPAQSDVDLSRSSTASAEDLGASGKEGCDSLVAMATAPSESSINSNETNTLDAPSLSSNQDCSSSQATEAPSISDVTDSSNLLESQDNTDISDALRRMGLSLKRDENMEMTEELCQNLLIILFTVMWKGVEGADNKAWKERGQVFGAISYTSESHELLKPKVELTRKLIEMMLQGCIMDLKETGQTNVNVTMNSLEMVKTIYNFLCFDDTTPPKERFNERIIEDVMTLLDLMTVWELENSWREMEQLGLSILLAFAAQDDLNLCSIAAARLHNLLQTRPVDKLQESCYIMGAINGILTHALLESLDHYSFLIPVMKALVDKCSDLLNMKTYLPSLPATTMSPNFFDDFKTYCQSEEWRTFMEKQVLPSKFQYEANMFDEMQVSMKTYIGECHEEMMMDSHKRNRERGESKLKFESNIVEAFRSRAKLENKRYSNILTQMRNQNASVMRQWRATKLFFTGERGSWAEGYQLTQYWKLSNQENFSRMRPKLVPNYNFDPHLEASRLRDNQGAEEGPREVLPPIEVVKEAKVTGDDIGDDRLGDEEWNVISSANTTAAEELIGKEKLILSEDCELVTIMDVHRGRLEVTTTHIYFFDCSLNKEEGGGEDFKLALAQLREIHFRRYNLRRSALEIFLIDQSNYFLNFQKKIRNKVYSRILSLHPPNLIYYGSRSPAELLKASGLTQKWVQREISNFDYLMQLNTIAGRTYNDLSQYPVFPWILQDYVSENLDLENPHVFRDLSKPIGIINPNNEKEVKDKYDHFEDPTGTIEKFHYGTHYSNPAAVMTYLIRMEPFTTLHIELQSGKFDVADRQFYSIPATWQGLMENPNDVKELIPEFYYMPEFLENMNEFDLGKMQITEEVVSEVILPPWADSPEDFIYKHRKALESEYVSAHLHEWIDLIFGYKQKGAPAAEATNVFYYCTYEGAVDLDAITDPVQRKALEGMINNFGQTPCQLLKEAHPRRMTFEEAVTRASKIDRSLNLLWFHDQLKAFYVEAAQDTDPLAFVTVPRNQARSFIQHGMPDSMIGVTEDGVLAIHGWLPYDKSISNYFTFEKDPSVSNSKSKKRLAGPFAPGLKVTEKLFAVSHDAKLVLSGGHWDNSLRAYSIPKSKNVSHIIRHTDIVTCISLDYCGSHLISGSRDTTCMVWELLYQNGSCSGLGGKPLQVLYGHDSEVTSVAISVELDLAVSGSKDGTVIIHTVRRGHYMRTLRPPGELGWKICIQQLTLSDIGQIVLYCTEHHPTKPNTAENLALHVYSINGKHLSYEILSQPIRHMVVTEGHVLIGSTHGSLIIKEVFGLKTLTTMPLHVPVQCVSVTNGNSHALVGLKDGKLIIIGIKKQAELKYKTGLDKILLTANSPLSD